jgi:methionyl-tRNA formyltransferase
MNIIFAGTPSFASIALEALIKAGHSISLVLTKPDSISGRGNTLHPSEVKVKALEYNLRVETPHNLKTQDAHDLIANINADIMVVAAYGHIIPKNILNLPKLGCINIHGSILPKWRGAAPIQRAILSGDKETGITIIQMNEGLDTGDILSIYPIPILEKDSTQSLYDKLSYVGAEAIVNVLSHIHEIKPLKQSDKGATYASKLSKEEALINWTDSSEIILNKIRGYNPFPGAFTHLHDKTLKIWEAQKVDNKEYDTLINMSCGEIVFINAKTLIVKTGDGFISLKVLQLPNAKRLAVQDFLAGQKNLLNVVLN